MNLLQKKEDFFKKINIIFFFKNKLYQTFINRLFLQRGIIKFYNTQEESEVFDLIKKIKSENELLLTYNEAFQLYMAAKKTVKVNGDMAEVGVYKGASAALICSASNNKKLHLFDTFEGLPEVSNKDNKNQFFKGQFKGAFDFVVDYLKKYKNVYFYKGMFPDTAEPVKDNKFSFVHLDVDIYKSTLDSLEFFYPRMSKGGIIISHDYAIAPGVKKAFDDFFIDKKEPIIELIDTQCLVVKV